MKAALGKKVGTGVLVLMMTVCCMPVIAGAFAPGDGRPGKGFDQPNHGRLALGIWRSPLVIKKLKLTKEQVKQLRDADFTAREKQLELRGQLGRVLLQLEKTMAADTLDDKAVIKMAKKIADLKGKLFVHKIESDLAVGDILNADQVAELKLLSRRHKRQGRRTGGRYLPSSYAVEKPEPKPEQIF